MCQHTVEKTIRDTIVSRGLLAPGDHVVLGLSGGPDSLTLYTVLKDLDLILHPVHVNHMLRPGDAEADRDFVSALCERDGTDLLVAEEDCRKLAEEEGLTEEEAGRKLRYGAFFQRAEDLVKEGIPRERIKVAVAHNRDDQAETILQRLLRGTGPEGLAGMAYLRQDAKGFAVIRPLLDVPREQIEDFCREKGLSPRRDHTNEEPLYLRNRIRLELLPLLQEYNPNIRESLVRLGNLAFEDTAFFAGLVEGSWPDLLVKEEEGSVTLKRQALAGLPASLRSRVYREACRRAGLTKDVTAAHLAAADALILGERSSGASPLPGDYAVTCSYDRVRFGREAFIKEEREPVLKTEILSGEAEGALFDADLLPFAPEELVLRTRRPGDFLAIPGGRKKIQDLFVDGKVPKEERDRIRFVAAGSEVLWIPELGRYSVNYRVTGETRRFLRLEILSGE